MSKLIPSLEKIYIKKRTKKYKTKPKKTSKTNLCRHQWLWKQAGKGSRMMLVGFVVKCTGRDEWQNCQRKKRWAKNQRDGRNGWDSDGPQLIVLSSPHHEFEEPFLLPLWWIFTLPTSISYLQPSTSTPPPISLLLRNPTTSCPSNVSSFTSDWTNFPKIKVTNKVIMKKSRFNDELNPP